MTHEIAINVLANLIASLILVAIAALFIGVGSAFNFKRIFQFFGIASRRPSVTILLSRLEIQPKGAKGADAEIQVGYVGPAINHIEYIGALKIRDLLRSKLLTVLPKGLADWMGKQFRLRIIEPKIALSPRQYASSEFDLTHSVQVADDVVFVLGSSAYNSITQHCLNHPNFPYHFKRNDAKTLVLMSRNGGEVTGRPTQELGIVQKITEQSTGRIIFLCAGIGTSATLGCVDYLIRNWRDLQKRFAKDFVVCLAFKGQPPDSETVTRPEVVPGGYHDMR